MEIRSPGTSSLFKTTSSSKKSKVSSSGLFKNFEVEQDVSSPLVQSDNFSLSIDPLFSELEQQKGNQKGMQIGEKILDELDRLRAVLMHESSQDQARQTLNHIQSLVQNLSRVGICVRLNDILDEIETRAVVELAKLGRNS